MPRERHAIAFGETPPQALRAMAVEYGKSPAETLADLVFALDEDASIARRFLRVQRMAPPRMDVAAAPAGAS
ncbi:MAG: hypothetical protein WB766_09070 [Roseiarcus sp.]